jgi:hypothetical protein
VLLRASFGYCFSTVFRTDSIAVVYAYIEICMGFKWPCGRIRGEQVGRTVRMVSSCELNLLSELLWTENFCNKLIKDNRFGFKLRFHVMMLDII